MTQSRDSVGSVDEAIGSRHISDHLEVTEKYNLERSLWTCIPIDVFFSILASHIRYCIFASTPIAGRRRDTHRRRSLDSATLHRDRDRETLTNTHKHPHIHHHGNWPDPPISHP